MKSSGNGVLITGGATGIGLALTEAFLREGNDVVICGRREEKLLEAKEKLPKVVVKTCDVADPDDRKGLLEWVQTSFPGLNILVNNAGVQREIDFRKGTADLSGEDEIETNLRAPVWLSALFAPRLMGRKESAIVNVSSGLAFVPLAIMPLYCATKAALHSFSLSLRRQLRDTSVKVFEVIPPTVDTELDRGARDKRNQADRGIKPWEVAEAVLAGLKKDEFEIVVGRAQYLLSESRNAPDKIFQALNG